MIKNSKIPHKPFKRIFVITIQWTHPLQCQSQRYESGIKPNMYNFSHVKLYKYLACNIKELYKGAYRNEIENRNTSN